MDLVVRSLDPASDPAAPPATPTTILNATASFDGVPHDPGRACFFVSCAAPARFLRFETSADTLASLSVWDVKLKLESFLPDVAAVDMVLALHSVTLDDDWEGVSFGLQHGTRKRWLPCGRAGGARA